MLEMFQFNYFTCSCPIFPEPLIEEAVLSSLHTFASFVKDKVPIGAWVYLWAFYLVPLIYVSAFVPVPYCLDDCSFVIQSEVRKLDFYSSIIFPQDCFGYSGPLYVHTNCKIYMEPQRTLNSQNNLAKKEKAEGIKCSSFRIYYKVTVIKIARYQHKAGEGTGAPRQYACLENPMDGAWEAAAHGVAKSRTRLRNFTFTFHFHALEKEMATLSSVLAWRIPGTGEPGGLPFMGLHRVGHD